MDEYNISYEIAAVIAYVVSGFFYFRRKHIEKGRHIIFTWLFCFAFGTLIFDVIGALSIDNQMDWIPVMVFNTVYYILKQGTVFFFLYYVISYLEMKEKIRIGKKLVMTIPAACMLMIILSNPITGILFSYTQTNSGWYYASGWARYVNYAVIIFYYLWACRYVSKEYKEYEKSLRMEVYVLSGLNVFALVFQLINKSYLVVDYSMSMSILVMVMMSLQRDNILDHETGLATKAHLDLTVRRMIYNEYPFHSVMVRLADYDLLTTSYGVTNAEAFVVATGKYLSGFVPLGSGFKVSNSCFVLNVDADEDVEKLERKILVGVNNSRVINDVEMTGTFFISRLSYPEKFKDIDTYNAYLTYFQKMKKMRYGMVSMDELKIRDKVRERRVEAAIERGLENHSFEVYYQPICTTEDQRFVTAEALVRLTDPELGPISPAEFIPISESNGTIIKIGRIVMEEVCRFGRNHDMDALGLEYLELNLSAVQCLQRDFIQFVDEITAKYEVPPSKICFEITETASNCAPAIFTENLAQLNERGFKLALDDFGTGYGNLQRMVTSSFAIIKFDKTMTNQICAEERLENMFITMKSMFHSMGSVVVAEGVETEEQYEMMKKAGCDYIQGYYFSQPLPEKEFVKFLEAHR